MTRVYIAYATVLKITDGDTFDSMLDIGWGIQLRPRRRPEPGLGTIRVLFPTGAPYDAPERATVEGKAAWDAARTLCKPGDELRVLSFRLDDFGRTLGAVTLPGGSDWATVMSEMGYVKPTS